MKKQPFTVAIVDSVFDDYSIEKEILMEAGCDVRVYNPENENELETCTKDANAVIVNLHQINSRIIKGMRKCRVISRYGVGYDNVDLKAATDRNIWVANVPDYCIEETSDHAVSLLLACARNTCLKDRQIREGGWKLEHTCTSVRLAGKTLGLIGFGKIGRAVYKKLSGWNFERIFVYDPYVDPGTLPDSRTRLTDLATLCRESDFISVHAPLNDETRHMISKPEIALMKKSTSIINTARGKIIDEAALAQALDRGKIRSAGLDVIETEPPKSDNPLRFLENVIITGHTAYHSGESLIELKTRAALNVTETITNNRPMYPVNSLEPTACERIMSAV